LTDPKDPEKRVADPPDAEGGAESIIIIGSGFGGAVAACRLAQAGFDIHVLERGRRYGPNDFPPLPVEPALLPDLQRWTWQHDQGLWDIVDLEEIISVQAAGYGGGSLIYANVQLRPPNSVFDDRWPGDYQNGKALAEYFPLGSYMLDAAPIGEHTIFPDIVKADQLKKAMGHLGRASAFFHPPLAINRKDQTTIGGRTQKACIGCGACCSGCPETAKNTLDYNYLALAENHGARIRTQCEVTDIYPHATTAVPGDGGWLVEYIDHCAGEKRRIRGKHVFLCAGSVHSTRLMARARLESVQSRVGVGYFPGGDALGMVYDTANVQYPSFGPTITTTTVHWEEENPALYLLLQDGGYARELARLVGLLQAPAWVGRNRLSTAKVPAPTAASPFSKLASEQRAPANLTAISSIVDDVAKAIAGGNLSKAIPTQLRAAWPDVIKELTKPLLLRPVVTSVIEGAMRDFFASFLLTKDLDTKGLVIRALHWVGRCAIRFFFGTDQDLAERALRSILRGADLPSDTWATKVLGYDDAGADNRLMLLAMGRDAASGTLIYYPETDRLVADLDLFDLAPGYSNEERLMTDVAESLGGELRTNPAWAFLGKPITVHNQGGCPMSDDPAHGVTNPDGKVWGSEGLYVLDGAALCTSVGVNPSATITAMAERNILRFIRKQRNDETWPQGDKRDGAKEYEAQRAAAQGWGKGWTVSPPDASVAPPRPFHSKPLGIEFHETLQGYYAETPKPLKFDDDRYLVFETKGRPSHPVDLSLTLSAKDLNAFFADEAHKMDVPTGTVKIRLPEREEAKEYPVVKGEAQIFAPKFTPYGVKPDKVRVFAQERLAGKKKKEDERVIARAGDGSGATTRFFNYLLWFNDGDKPWTLFGYKRVRDNPAADAWRDTSTLFVTLFAGHVPADEITTQESCTGAGAVHTELSSFLFDQLNGLKATGTQDPLRTAWATTSFATFFFGSLLRIYSPGITTAANALFAPRHSSASNPKRKPWRTWTR
jgi:choline dehydrogenase-like flavoprotein